MAVNLSIAYNQVAAALNALSIATYAAPPGTLATLDDTERRSVQEIYDALVSADGDVCRLICQTPGHGHRKDFFATQPGLLNPDVLNSRIGAVESVSFVITGGTTPGTRVATEFDKLEIYYENLNPLSLISLDCHYWIEGHRITHNGAAIAAITGGSVSVNVTACAYTRSTANPPLLQAPDEYTGADCCKALAMIIAKEGHHTEAGGFYFEQWKDYAADIQAGAVSLRSLMTLAGERAPLAQPTGAAA